MAFRLYTLMYDVFHVSVSNSARIYPVIGPGIISPTAFQISIQCKWEGNRAAEIFGGFWSQTQLLSLTQNGTAYQFLGPYDIVLSRPESFEVGHFKANIEI